MPEAGKLLTSKTLPCKSSKRTFASLSIRDSYVFVQYSLRRKLCMMNALDNSVSSTKITNGDKPLTGAKGSHAHQKRQEHDLLGSRLVDQAAYYGIHTLRASENFQVTKIPLSAYPELLRSFASVKQAAARTNAKLGLLDPTIADAIELACSDIRSGALHTEFIIDVVQGGAGTSTNMNANEVIANRALEILGYARGTYEVVHPLEHVNLGQSTNDAYPTALKIALYEVSVGLYETLLALSQAFRAKGHEFADVLKIGRTQLQDAVPITLGQEFVAYANLSEQSANELLAAREHLLTVNLGGTAIGTGLNAHPKFPQLVCENLSAITDISITSAHNLVESTQDTWPFTHLSAAVKHAAVKLSKISSDLRLLASGPRAGLSEINLPAVQAGSSIMPGKINPVIPEVVNQVAYEVIGNDASITHAAEAGQLELNVFEPIIGHSLFKSINHLSKACETLRTRCVEGITANEEHLRTVMEKSIGIATAFSPYVGYNMATEVAMQALETGRSIPGIILERDLMTEQEIEAVLTPERLIPTLSVDPAFKH